MSSVSSSILCLCLVIFCGLCLGKLQYKRIGLGSAGVLFAGIFAGHWGYSLDSPINYFLKELGLILFVFTMGIQLGPGIIQLWKHQGLILNGMAMAIVVQGVLLTILFASLMNLTAPASAGLFSGATTNTPSMGAAQQTVAQIRMASSQETEEPNSSTVKKTTTVKEETLTTAYAVAYPGGIVGIIAAMLLIKWWFQVDLPAEEKQQKERVSQNQVPLVSQCVEVENERLNNVAFGEIPGVKETGVRVSRVQRLHQTEVESATDQTILVPGDKVLVVGTQQGLNRFTPLIGKAVPIDLKKQQGNVEFRRLAVTAPKAFGKSLQELALDHVYGVSVTRIIRAGIEMTPHGTSRFHYGDVAHVVGRPEALDRVSEFLGNSRQSLDETPFLAVFIGIAIGVCLGMIPLSLPGLPFTVRLGLAGGPLLAAIGLSLIGNWGQLVWYIPANANKALREFGILLFLACAGLGAGKTFFAAALSWKGMAWMSAGICITMIPLLTTAFIARAWGKLNYLTISGVIAGSMTDPPALAFANSMTSSNACATAYAAVYPLTMILRILSAQVLITLLM